MAAPSASVSSGIENQMPHKTLTKIVNLEGQSETITAMELRKTPGDILMQAALGDDCSLRRLTMTDEWTNKKITAVALLCFVLGFLTSIVAVCG